VSGREGGRGEGNYSEFGDVGSRIEKAGSRSGKPWSRPESGTGRSRTGELSASRVTVCIVCCVTSIKSSLSSLCKPPSLITERTTSPGEQYELLSARPRYQGLIEGRRGALKSAFVHVKRM